MGEDGVLAEYLLKIIIMEVIKMQTGQRSGSG